MRWILYSWLFLTALACGLIAWRVVRFFWEEWWDARLLKVQQDIRRELGR